MRHRSLSTAVVVGTFAFVLGAGGVGAQDASPAADDATSTDLTAEAHPAHIHSGSCGDQLGDVVFPLTDVAQLPTDASAESDVMVSQTTVEASLDDILAQSHAINVHKSNAEMGVYVACGEITGPIIRLSELDGSGLSGFALLSEGDAGTAVTVLVADDSAMMSDTMDPAESMAPTDGTDPAESMAPTDGTDPAESMAPTEPLASPAA